MEPTNNTTISLNDKKAAIISALQKKPFLLFNSKPCKNRIYTKCERCLTYEDKQERSRPLSSHYNILSQADVGANRPNFVRVLECYNENPDKVCAHRLQSCFQQLNCYVSKVHDKIQAMLVTFDMATTFQYDHLCLAYARAEHSADKQYDREGRAPADRYLTNERKQFETSCQKEGRTSRLQEYARQMNERIETEKEKLANQEPVGDDVCGWN